MCVTFSSGISLHTSLRPKNKLNINLGRSNLVRGLKIKKTSVNKFTNCSSRNKITISHGSLIMLIYIWKYNLYDIKYKGFKAYLVYFLDVLLLYYI